MGAHRVYFCIPSPWHWSQRHFKKSVCFAAWVIILLRPFRVSKKYAGICICYHGRYVLYVIYVTSRLNESPTETRGVNLCTNYVSFEEGHGMYVSSPGRYNHCKIRDDGWSQRTPISQLKEKGDCMFLLNGGTSVWKLSYTWFGWWWWVLCSRAILHSIPGDILTSSLLLKPSTSLCIAVRLSWIVVAWPWPLPGCGTSGTRGTHGTRYTPYKRFQLRLPFGSEPWFLRKYFHFWLIRWWPQHSSENNISLHGDGIDWWGKKWSVVEIINGFKQSGFSFSSCNERTVFCKKC